MTTKPLKSEVLNIKTLTGLHKIARSLQIERVSTYKKENMESLREIILSKLPEEPEEPEESESENKVEEKSVIVEIPEKVPIENKELIAVTSVSNEKPIEKFGFKFYKKQEPAHQIARLSGHQFFFAYQYEWVDTKGTRGAIGKKVASYMYSSYSSLEDFCRVYSQIPQSDEKCFFEQIREGCECRMFFDLDGESHQEVFVNYTDYPEEPFDEVYPKYVEAFLKLHTEYRQSKGYPYIRWNDVVMKDSSTKSKFSIHILYDWYFTDMTKQKCYMLDFYDFAKNRGFVFDKSVYSSNRNMRMIQSTKAGKSRFLVRSSFNMKSQSAPFSHFFITNPSVINTSVGAYFREGEECTYKKRYVTIPEELLIEKRNVNVEENKEEETFPANDFDEIQMALQKKVLHRYLDKLIENMEGTYVSYQMVFNAGNYIKSVYNGSSEGFRVFEEWYSRTNRLGNGSAGVVPLEEQYRKCSVNSLKKICETRPEQYEVPFIPPNVEEGTLIKSSHSDWVREYSFKKKCLMVRAEMGHGKTVQTMKLLKEGNFKRVLIVTPRISFAMGINQEILSSEIKGFTSYRDKGFNVKNDKIIVQCESLHKIANEVEYDLVILDEVESILYQMCAPTHSQNLIENNNTLESVLLRAGKILCLDGFLSSRTTTYFKSLKISYDVIRYKFKPNEKKVVHLDSFKSMLGAIDDCLKNGKKLFIYSSSKTKVIRDIEPLLKERSGGSEKNGCRWKAYHSDSGNKIDAKVSEEWLNLDVVVCTSSITVGLDFNVKDYFDCTFGYISRMSGVLIRDFFQGLHRVRHTKEKTLYLVSEGFISSDAIVPKSNRNAIKNTLKKRWGILENEGFEKKFSTSLFNLEVDNEFERSQNWWCFNKAIHWFLHECHYVSYDCTTQFEYDFPKIEMEHYEYDEIGSLSLHDMEKMMDRAKTEGLNSYEKHQIKKYNFQKITMYNLSKERIQMLWKQAIQKDLFPSIKEVSMLLGLVERGYTIKDFVPYDVFVNNESVGIERILFMNRLTKQLRKYCDFEIRKGITLSSSQFNDFKLFLKENNSDICRIFHIRDKRVSKDEWNDHYYNGLLKQCLESFFCNFGSKQRRIKKGEIVEEEKKEFIRDYQFLTNGNDEGFCLNDIRPKDPEEERKENAKKRIEEENERIKKMNDEYLLFVQERKQKNGE